MVRDVGKRPVALRAVVLLRGPWVPDGTAVGPREGGLAGLFGVAVTPRRGTSERTEPHAHLAPAAGRAGIAKLGRALQDAGSMGGSLCTCRGSLRELVGPRSGPLSHTGGRKPSQNNNLHPVGGGLWNRCPHLPDPPNRPADQRSVGQSVRQKRW